MWTFEVLVYSCSFFFLEQVQQQNPLHLETHAMSSRGNTKDDQYHELAISNIIVKSGETWHPNSLFSKTFVPRRRWTDASQNERPVVKQKKNGSTKSFLDLKRQSQSPWLQDGPKLPPWLPFSAWGRVQINVRMKSSGSINWRWGWAAQITAGERAGWAATATGSQDAGRRTRAKAEAVSSPQRRRIGGRFIRFGHGDVVVGGGRRRPRLRRLLPPIEAPHLPGTVHDHNLKILLPFFVCSLCSLLCYCILHYKKTPACRWINYLMV
jgi:hypothetical protein